MAIPNKEVGIVMQDFALIAGYTVLENVMIVKKRRKKMPEKNKNKKAGK